MLIGKTIAANFCRSRPGSCSGNQWSTRSLLRWNNNAAGVTAAGQQPFAVYLHWPYCESKCTYCNFNKYVNPSNPPVERLSKALLKEIDYYLNLSHFGLKQRKITSVYFGGGTPSLASPSTVERILTALNVSSDVEVTLEANPTSSEASRLRDFKQAGINRLSLGVQSFNDTDLKLMGRDHTGKEAVANIEEAKRLFDNFTFDLIFARPGQTISDWKRELEHTLKYLAGDHLSIYQLTMERGTPLWKSRKLIPPLPSLDEAADMYDLTIQMAEQYGFAHYEVSNYARKNTAISRHNFSYWQGMDYLGIGPGAHGRLTNLNTLERIRTFGEFHPEKYMALCEQEGEGIRKWIPIPPREMREELIVFGLRTRMGIPQSRFKKLTGQNLMDLLDTETVDNYINSGFLLLHEGDWPDSHRYTPQQLRGELQGPGGLRPTEAGLARMDSILPNIFR